MSSVMSMEEFFKRNYKRMVGYCISEGFNDADVEEEISSAIFNHYYDYMKEIKASNKERAVRSWLNTCAIRNIIKKYNKKIYTTAEVLPEDHEEVSHLDNPENILCLKQRLPEVRSILIEYEPKYKTGGNDASFRTLHTYHKRKFMERLAA